MSNDEKKKVDETVHQHMHSHIDANGNVYTHCHDDNVIFCEHDHEHYHVDELGNLYSHVHDHGSDDDKVPIANHTHTHGRENGNVHTHSHEEAAGAAQHDHEHDHEHNHDHDHNHEHEGENPQHVHTHTKAVINRLSRAIGHLESVKRMVENGRDCTEVLIQLAAVRSALSSTAKVILKDHLEHCVANIDPDDPDQFKALNDAIDRFM